MSDDVTIYHNPQCSKSRETLRLLQEEDLRLTVVEYLKTPPSPEALRELATMLGIRLHGLLRTKEPAYAQAGLSESSTDEEILDAIVAYPKLLERPIVAKDGRAEFGRPPAKVLEIL